MAYSIKATFFQQKSLIYYSSIFKKHLMENFKQIEHIFENAPIGIFETTPEGKFVDLNNELVKILGYKSKQDVFDHIQSLETDLYEKPEMRHEMLNTIRGKSELSRFEYRFKKKDQSVIDVRLSIRQMWKDELKKYHHIGIVEDITDLKKIQKKHNEQQLRYKQLFESSNDAILLYKYDKLIDYNQKALKIFGAEHQTDFLANFANLNPEYQPNGRRSDEFANEIIEKTLNGEPQFFEWVHLRADGTTFIAEISLSKMEGEEDGLLQSIIRDITEKIQLKNNLIKRESILSAIIDSIPSNMWVIDFEKNVITQSGFSKRIWGDYTGQPIGSFISKNFPNISIDYPTEKIKKGEILEKEVTIDINNQKRTLKIYWAPYIEQEEIKGFVVYSYDLTSEKALQKKLEKHQKDLEIEVNKRTEEISALNSELLVSNDYLNELNQELQTQKKELQEALETLKTTQSQLIQSEKMASIGVLTSGIAHEINNPINFISSGVYGLKMVIEDILNFVDEIDKNCSNLNNENSLSFIEELKEKHKIEKAITNIPKLITPIQNGISRTTEIIKGLRTFNRLDAEEKTIGNIKDIIESTLIILKNKYKDRITITLDLDPKVEILCYPGKLGQVILNITMNAIQAIEDKGEIQIKTSYDSNSGFFEIKISDTGHGIDKINQAKIFDPFFTTKPVGIGTGIGLSIVHGIIKDHSGTITVKSKPQKGTTFTIKIPTK